MEKDTNIKQVLDTALFEQQGEEVIAWEISTEDSIISTDSCGVCRCCNSHLLSFGYSEKTNANEGYTLQISFGCHSR
jgi:hypothetical protein